MFQMGLVIYVSLLLLTPEILNLPFDPQDNAFLSWAHSYAAFHNWSNCWVCGALPSSSVEGFPWWTSPLQGKDFLQVCEYLRQQSQVMPLLRLMTSNNPRMDWCNTLYHNYRHNMTFNFDYTLSQFNDYFATHKTNRSRSDGFLPDIYQIWYEVIWLTPEKGRLISTAPICWEQTEPSPKVSQQLNYNDWKQLGFLPQEICNIIIPVFSNPSSGSPFVWPGTSCVRPKIRAFVPRRKYRATQ